MKPTSPDDASPNGFEPEEPDIPGPRRRRRWPIIVAIVVVLIVLASRSLALFYTDLLWYKEVGFTTVFWKLITSQFTLAVLFGAFVFLVIYVNLRIVARTRRAYTAIPRRRNRVEDEVLLRYREYAAPYFKWISAAIAAFFALTLGLSARAAYSEWLLFSHSVPFGVSDPVFHVDNSFYVFRLGFLRFLSGRFFAILMVTIIVTVIAHFLEGGIRLQNPAGQRISSAAKVHLSILFALLALTRAYGYWLDRYSLVFSERGVVTGAGATDLNATLPALNFLIIISIIVAVLLIINIWYKGWALPLVALGVWVVVSAIGIGLYPAFYQRFFVQPQEFTKEREYIDRNIEGTREGYSLETVKLNAYTPTQQLTFEEAKSGGIADSTRLWDPSISNDAFNQVQALRGYYRFPDGDIDRYVINGKRVQTNVAPRQLNRAEIPSKTWVNEHLQFTHGYGMVISPANTAAVGNRPAFVMSDIPPAVPPEISATSPSLRLDQPAVYYGEIAGSSNRSSDYAIVRTKEAEFDYPRGSQEETTSEYQGSGGVQMDSFLKQTAFSLRFGDLNPLISTQITDKSQLMFKLDVRDRVKSSMPFLALDADPYPAIVDGRIVWIQDAYTSSQRYPYSQKLNAVRTDRGAERVADRLPDGSDLKQEPDANYVRNSVKAVVDAYDGTVKLYVVDESDPIIQSYSRMFPGTLTPGSEASPALRAHFRYAEDYFRAQSDMYRIYHVSDSRTFYNQEDKWQVPVGVVGGNKVPLVPYYTLLQLPGANTESFEIVQPFTPPGKPNLLGFITGDSDPESFGTINAYAFPRDRPLDGPETVTAKFNTDPQISAALTLLNQQGSHVKFASLLTLPISGDLIYVQPVFVVPENVNLPTLQRVIASHKDRVVMRECAVAAVADVLAEPPNSTPTPCPAGAATPYAAVAPSGQPVTVPPAPTGQATPQPGQTTAPPAGLTQQQALANAQAAYDDAQTALRAGNLALYQQKVDEMKRWIDAAKTAPSG